MQARLDQLLIGGEIPEFAAVSLPPSTSQPQQADAGDGPVIDLPLLISRVCRDFGIAPLDLRAGRRGSRCSDARAVTAYLAADSLGLSQALLAPALGLTPSGVSKAYRRGRSLLDRHPHLARIPKDSSDPATAHPPGRTVPGSARKDRPRVR